MLFRVACLKLLCVCGHWFNVWNKIIAGISCKMHVSLLRGVQFLIYIYDVFHETAMFMQTA